MDLFDKIKAEMDESRSASRQSSTTSPISAAHQSSTTSPISASHQSSMTSPRSASHQSSTTSSRSTTHQSSTDSSRSAPYQSSTTSSRPAFSHQSSTTSSRSAAHQSSTTSSRSAPYQSSTISSRSAAHQSSTTSSRSAPYQSSTTSSRSAAHQSSTTSSRSAPYQSSTTSSRSAPYQSSTTSSRSTTHQSSTTSSRPAASHQSSTDFLRSAPHQSLATTTSQHLKRTAGAFSRNTSAAPLIKKKTYDSGSQSTGGNLFKSATEEVQLNMWTLDISGMDEKMIKIDFRVTLKQDKAEFVLNMGLALVGGDRNRQIRRRAQWQLFQLWFKQNKALFRGKTDSSVAAYDCADTIFVASSNISDDYTENACELTSEHFTDDEWSIVSKLSRRKIKSFSIKTKANGHVYTRGEHALQPENRPELARCIETVTNQVLHNGNFYLYKSGTYPVSDKNARNSNDGTTLIKTGFHKQTRVIENSDGTPKVLMTLDLTSSVFHREQSVLEFMASKYMEDTFTTRRDDRRDSSRTHGRNSDFSSNAKQLERDIRDRRVPRTVMNELAQALKRLVCEPKHLEKTEMNRAIIISDISKETAENFSFDWKNGEDVQHVTVKEYFKNKHSYGVTYPHMPLITSKHKNHSLYFPAEVLMIPAGQRVKAVNLSRNLQTILTKESAKLPLTRTVETEKILTEDLKLGRNASNKHTESFKIKLYSAVPVHAMAKILAPPKMKFASNWTLAMKSNHTARLSNFGKFLKPASGQTVAVINFDADFNPRDFCENFEKECKDEGIVFTKEHKDWKVYNTQVEDIVRVKQIMSECSAKKCTIVIGICKDKFPAIHDVMKYYEHEMKLVTMQITTDTARKIANGQKSTKDNVIRKFNAKCGGTNFDIDIPEVDGVEADRLREKLYNKTQFIGFDLSHTGARTTFDIATGNMEGDPTTVGVSYTLKKTTKLGGFSYYQEKREHRLMHLQDKFFSCIKMYDTEELPETVVIYRCGAGEGDYDKILEEVEDIRASCRQNRPGYHPKIVMISALRHSHIRVYPKEIPKDKRSSVQNVRSGTCIDSMTPSVPGFEEFILCSQIPLMGTSRPTKYVIIANEANWSKNEILNVTYHLAFGHQVCYQQTSLPSVLYAAKNLSKRGHNNYKTYNHLGEINRVTDRLTAKHSDVVTEADKKELSDTQIGRMDLKADTCTMTRRVYWA